MFKAIFKFLSSLPFAVVHLSVFLACALGGALYDSISNSDFFHKFINDHWGWLSIWMGLLWVNLLCVRVIFKFLATLKFAIGLLSVIILASIAGTIWETKFNSDVAQKFIYGAWWFNIWLSALAVNLYCVAAVRYPWKRHLTGFVITHAGIITLLTGAMIDRMWGIEGSIQLHTTKTGTTQLELRQQELRVKIGGEVAKTHFKVSTLWNARTVESPDKNVLVEIADVEPVTEGYVLVDAEEHDKTARPGLNITLQGPMMGRNDFSLLLNDSKDLGRATLMFLAGSPEEPPSNEAYRDSDPELTLSFQGKSFKFPLKAGESQTQSLEGILDWKIDIKGYYPNFRMDEGKPVTLGTEPLNPVVQFELVGPNVNGVAAKDDGSNIAEHGIKQDPKLVAPHRERFFVFGKEKYVMNSPLHGDATGADATLTVKLASNAASRITSAKGTAIYLSDDGKLRYTMKSIKKGAAHGGDDETGGSIEKSGEVEFEKPIPVTWGPPGTECVVHEFIEKAVRKFVFTPHPELLERGDPDNLNQGLKMRVTVGKESKELWIGQTLLDQIFPQELEVAGRKVSFEFVSETVDLPFTVQLKKFNAPFDEGSTEFAAFESILSFDGNQDTIWLKSDSDAAKETGKESLVGAIIGETDDEIEFRPQGKKTIDNRIINAQTVKIAKSDIARTERLTQKISMNIPTTFPVSWYGPYLGTCYKFSQASHHILPNDPEHSDPEYSGVQVLRDPGWFFKWVGCIMICSGIFTMFYLRPYFNRPKDAPKAVEPKPEDVAADKKKKRIQNSEVRIQKDHGRNKTS